MRAETKIAGLTGLGVKKTVGKGALSPARVNILLCVLCRGSRIILAIALALLAGAVDCPASEKNDSLTLSHYIKGLLCDRRGEHAQAILEYEQAVISDPKNPFVRVKLAAQYMAGENYRQAIENLQAAAGYRPDLVEPHALLALVFYLQGQPEKSLQEYEIALQKASDNKPADFELYRSLGRLYLYHGKLKDAQRVFKQAAILSAESWDAHFYLGDISYRLGDKKAAEAELIEAIRLKADCHQALNYLGYMYIEEGRNLKEAEVMVKKAVSLQPNNGAYLDSLGWLYFKKGLLKEAGRELQKASVLLEDPVIYDHLGDLCIKNGDKDGAVKNWQKSLQLDSQQTEVKKKLERIKKSGEPAKNAK